jgi:hypothetical protein
VTPEELYDLVRADRPPPPEHEGICGLLVAPDVWAKLAATLPQSIGDPPPYFWRVTVNHWLPPGCIVPTDKDGKPILKAAKYAPDGSPSGTKGDGGG